MSRFFTVIAQPLLIYASLILALGAFSVSIVVGHATTCARVVVVAIAICIAMYCSNVHRCWAIAGCFPVWPSHTLCQQSYPLEYLGVSY